MRRLFITLLFGLLLAQVRVGEMRSITSTLDVRDLITTGQDLFLATAGGLAKYNINSGDYKIYTKDQGMGDTDINIVYLDSKGFVWIGSKMGVQVWDPDQEKREQGEDALCLSLQTLPRNLRGVPDLPKPTGLHANQGGIDLWQRSRPDPAEKVTQQ